MGVVPAKVFGQERAVYHDAGVLERVGGEHELVNIYVRGRKELFACKCTIFVYREALTTYNNNTRVLLHEAKLFLEPVW